MTTQQNIDQLQKRIAKLQRQVAQLTKERDEARYTVVSIRMGNTIRREGMQRYRGEYLPSDAIVQIQQGLLTLEQAVAQRNARWSEIRYITAGGDLATAYEMAV